MAATRSEFDQRPFNASGYEILDDDFACSGELTIWSVASPTPLIGDEFTVESRGQLRDIVVRRVRIFAAGWAATCRARP
jgi:hypothetical protein